MSSPIETIKEYLVSLGFSVDKGSYDQANKAVDTLDKSLKDFASGAVLNFGKAALAVTGFFVAAQAGIGKFMNSVGNQEVQMEVLSRQLWTTQQQAVAFNGVMKALGANLADVYMSPTLQKQFNELRRAAGQMTLPGDYQKTIGQVQDLQLQFKMLRLEGYYSLQWIAFYLTKYLSGPLSKAQQWLANLNKLIIKGMPTWTKTVAQVMASFVQAGGNIAQALSKVWNWLKKMSDYLPGWAKGVAATLAVITISNPFMLIVEGIGAALLLLDDFMTYLKDPSKSAFPKLWSWVMKLYDTMTHNGTIATFQGDIESLLASVGNLGSSIYNLITAIGNLYGKLNGTQNQNGLMNFFQMLADMANAAIQDVTSAINVIGYFVTFISDVLNGKWLDAANMFVKYHQLLGAGPPVSNAAPNGGYTYKPYSSSKKSNNGANTAGAWGYTTPGGYGPKAYPYMFPHVSATTNHNTNTSSSKIVHAPVTVTQHIHGSNAHQVAKTSHDLFVNQGLMTAFRSIIH